MGRDLCFRNQVVFVAGGSSGIGKSVVAKLLNSGAKVAVCSRNEMKQRNSKTTFLKINVDAKNELEVQLAIEKIIKKFGKIDVLVNCIGGDGIVKPLLECTAKDWIDDFEQNFFTAVKLCNKVVPYMKSKGYGRIINISSIAGVKPDPLYTPYCAAKAALLVFTKALAFELIDFNINVNAILPGIINTAQMKRVENIMSKISKKLSPMEIKKQFSNEIPLGRYGSPEEVADLILFLGSKVSSYITGAQFVIDGGMLSQL